MDGWMNASKAVNSRFPAIHYSINPSPHFFLPGRLTVGQRSRRSGTRMLVQFQPRQPLSFTTYDLRLTKPVGINFAARKS
jgi:hypothetical protein